MSQPIGFENGGSVPVDYHYKRPNMVLEDDKSNYTIVPRHKSIDIGGINSVQQNHNPKQIYNYFGRRSYSTNIHKIHNDHEFVQKNEDLYMSDEERLFRNQYPEKFVKIHSSIMIVLSLTVIVMQILSMIYQAPYYYIASGIWAGAYFFAAAILALLIRQYSISYYYSIIKII